MNRTQRKTTNKGRKPRKKNLAVVDRPDHPGMIAGYEITHTRRLRFTVTAAVANQQISFSNLLDTILFATTATAPFDVFDIVKVNWVQVWGQAALGTPSSVAVSFNSATGDRSLHQDTSLGIKPAYIKAVPSPKSLASFFQPATGGNAFIISAPAGSIVDVSLTFRDVPNAAQGAIASVGATVGSIFYRGLDGLAAAGTNFPVPAGIPSF